MHSGITTIRKGVSGMIIAVVGSGGKTTHIKQLANQYRKEKKTVLLCTSTHMMIEEDTVITDDPETIIHLLQTKHYAFVGTQDKQKLSALSMDTFNKVIPYADIVLIEADGSRQLPLKICNETEPVVYPQVDEIHVITNLKAVGKKASEVVHRINLSNDLTPDTIIDYSHVQKLLRENYLERLSQYPIKIIVNHEDSLIQKVMAKMIEENQDVTLIDPDFFSPLPTLIVYGAGHVGREVANMATKLDFKVKVLDDRQEFLNPSLFPNCELIYDTFDHILDYKEDNCYHVIITRGHKSDSACLRLLLGTNYEYLGMVGSKGKVKTTFETLLQEGYTQEQIDTVHSPIGLPIKARTPAEIAVSIFAEIIQEKNEKHESFLPLDILHDNEPGVLCIIIEKQGSGPRGRGSMMFVHPDHVVNTIGGGSIEYQAILDARECQHIMINEYKLYANESADLGMICGGSVKVLFIPLM